MLSVALFALLQAVPAPTAFVNVAIVSAERATVIPNQTVVVAEGRIQWIGPAAEARLAANTVRVDGRDRFLLPGFADLHTHPGRPFDLATFLANGITTIRVMWGDTATVRWRNAIAAGTMAGPRIVTAGAIIDGNPPSQPVMKVLTDPALARAEVLAQARAGYDFIKVYNSVPRPVYDTIIATARELGMPVAGHVPFEVGLGGALAAGQWSIEHLRGYIAELVPKDATVQPGATLRSRTLAWNHVDRTRIPELVRRTVAAGVWNCPTFVVAYHMMLPNGEYQALMARPEAEYFATGAPPDRSKISYLADFTEADFVAAQRALEPQFELARSLAQAGGKLLIGTDSWLQGYAYHDELRLFERAGFSRAEVLAIATKSGAEFLGKGASRGTIAVGQEADLQLVGGNPLASLENLRTRLGVMVGGRWYRRAAIDSMMGRPRP
ncbi:MAG: amidohydrolase family protein [Gemmatimonadales bacterium]